MWSIWYENEIASVEQARLTWFNLTTYVYNQKLK